MVRKIVKAADLFCGAGGSSTGLRQACEALGIKLHLIAVNHWNIAISTHKANHPDAGHLCANLDSVDPRVLVPSGKLDLLIASPECIFHSNARGGTPINDQSRASAWRIIEWLEKVEVDQVLIENVPEFRNWGPLIKKKVVRNATLPPAFVPFENWIEKTRRYGGTKWEWKKIYGSLKREGTDKKTKRKVTLTVWVPDPKRKGEIYIAFLKSLEAHGYTVEARVLNAADYSDPTSRARLFIRAQKRRKAIVWPEASHEPRQNTRSAPTLFNVRKLAPYRTAREDVIDWSIESESIFTRKKPLAAATMQRIWKGLEKFCGLPFIVPQNGDDRVRSIDKPLQTLTTTSRGIGVCQPFLIKYYGGQHSQSVDEPLPSITASYEHYGLCQPFLVGAGGPVGAGQPQSVDDPLGTVLGVNHRALVQPFIVELRQNLDARSVDKPLSTITASGNHHGLCQPFIVELRNGQDARSVDQPLSCITTKGAHHGICQPFLIRYHGNHDGRNDGASRVNDLDEPLPNLDTSNRYGLVQPFIIPTNHGKSDTRSHSIDNPMPTVTSVDAWGLIEPFLVKYNGTGGPMSVDDPLDTVTAKDRFGLVDGDVKQEGAVFLLDIRFRMLQPHELAAAMSFPKTYVFTGNREQKVKQIGNAVPVGLSTALCRTILSA